MILELLDIFARNPAALVSRSELAALLGDQFDAIVDSGIVAPAERWAVHVLGDGRVLRVDELPNGSLEGFDEFDPDFEPIPLCPDDIEEWTLDACQLARAIANAQGLPAVAGQILSPRFVLAVNIRRDLPMVIGLLNQSPSSTNAILAQRARLPAKTRGVVIVSPLFAPDALDQVTLERHGIVVAALRDDLSVRPSIEACAQSLTEHESMGTLEPDSGFLLAPDCRSATLRGRQYVFSAMQGAAVAVLLRAHLHGQVALHQSAILSEIESNSVDLKSVFKRNSAYGSLIKSDDRGRFRFDFSPE